MGVTEDGRTSSTSASLAPSSFSSSATRFSSSASFASSSSSPAPLPFVTPPGAGGVTATPSCARRRRDSRPAEAFAFCANSPSASSTAPGCRSPSASSTPSTEGESCCKSPRKSCSCCRMTAGETSRFLPFAGRPVSPSAGSSRAEEPSSAAFCARSDSLRRTSSSSSTISSRRRRRRSRGVSLSRSSGSAPVTYSRADGKRREGILKSV